MPCMLTTEHAWHIITVTVIFAKKERSIMKCKISVNFKTIYDLNILNIILTQLYKLICAVFKNVCT